MGGMLSRSSYVWLRRQRFRFNKIQADGEYYQLFSLGGFRATSGRRVTTQIMIEILEENLVTLNIDLESRESDYLAAKTSELALYKQMQTRINIKSKDDLLRFKDSPEGQNIYKTLAAKGADVKTKKQYYIVAKNKVKQETGKLKLAKNLATRLNGSNAEDISYDEWAKTMIPVSGMALANATTEVDNTATQTLMDNMSAVEEVEMDKFALDIDDDDAVNDSDIDRVMRLLLSPSTMSTEFREVTDKEARRERKNTVFSTGAGATTENDDDNLVFSQMTAYTPVPKIKKGKAKMPGASVYNKHESSDDGNNSFSDSY